jgi:hypothetical protein
MNRELQLLNATPVVMRICVKSISFVAKCRPDIDVFAIRLCTQSARLEKFLYIGRQ